MEGNPPVSRSNFPGRAASGLRITLLALAVLLGRASVAETRTNEPAQVGVSGFGFIANREMTRLLRNFQPDDRLPALLDRTFVEDAVLVLLARARTEGYLRAALQGQFTMADGTRQEVVWTNALEALLPREFAAREAKFNLREGVRFYYHSLTFTGLKAFSQSQAEDYFVSGGVLLELRINRIFNPAGLDSSLAALREAYARAGYESARVNTNRVTWNEATGAVDVEVSVREGRPTFVRSVEVRLRTAGNPATALRTLNPGKPFSRLWEQDLAQTLKAEQQIKGFPDTTVEFVERQRTTNAANIQLDLTATVTPGPFIRVGQIIERGDTNTKPSVVQSRIKLKPGEPLNLVEAEKSRQRLARLGVFDSVRLRYEPVDDATRNVVYEFAEGKPVSLSVLAGYGSYELLRGGLEFEDRNVFGLAHDLQVRGVQSFKSSSGDLIYTIPEAFGENVDLFLQGSGLLREEVTFTRKEYGGSLGLQKFLVPLKTDFTLRYDYEYLNSQYEFPNSPNLLGTEPANSAAFVLQLVRDRRDHPLLPKRGLKLFTQLEVASAALGGNVNYQRALVGASYHHDLGGGRLVHLGVMQGVTFVWGGDADQLPFNKRYFPGGANSVRGYVEGEASPLDVNGQQVGAETYTQFNLELEQLLTKTWSVVAFYDAVGFAQDRANYPWDEFLGSVGGGINWRSLIGPVRLEYGYNLNRRRLDPVGTLHFSVGFPF